MSSKSRILIVEDKENEREALARLLRQEGYDVQLAANADEAMTHLDSAIDLVISDLKMGENSGLDLLRFLKSRSPNTPVVMITAHGNVATAVEAMKLGAEDYLTKPVHPDELLMLVARCLEYRQKDEMIRHLQERLDERLGFERIIGNSKAILDVFDQARRAALSDCTVLVTGESGTGKELIAEALHQNSLRKKGPFVTVNMAAVPEQLVESELFGHVKGAFTGAMAARAGRFESAHGGTLFIDEIGDFAQASQAKLLRVLENHTITPIGSNDDRQVDVRTVAATSRRLEEMVRNHEFREDLYYRLNVVTIRLPPLRDRAEDIPLLIKGFLADISSSYNKPMLEVDPGLMRFLQTYEWPGNVRQLRNTIESMVVLARETTLTLNDVPATLESDPLLDSNRFAPAGTSLKEIERSLVEKALTEFNGHRARVAESLGISVRTLQRKLKAWGLDKSQPSGSNNGGADNSKPPLSAAVSE